MMVSWNNLQFGPQFYLYVQGRKRKEGQGGHHFKQLIIQLFVEVPQSEAMEPRCAMPYANNDPGCQTDQVDYRGTTPNTWQPEVSSR